MNKIAYEPHPVTPERKAELLAKGFQIIDARFKPLEPKQEPEQEPRRKARGSKP